MSTIEKLVNRMKTLPRDFSYEDATRIANHFGYMEKQGSGSRVRFYREWDKKAIILHKPHRPDGQNALIIGAMRDFVTQLKENGDIK